MRRRGRSSRFDLERFTQLRRPELLWNRAEDELLLGQRGKSRECDMLAIIKANTGHPFAGGWITRLESILAPARPAAPAGSTGITSCRDAPCEFRWDKRSRARPGAK
jgi:hypothetical protein